MMRQSFRRCSKCAPTTNSGKDYAQTAADAQGETFLFLSLTALLGKRWNGSVCFDVFLGNIYKHTHTHIHTAGARFSVQQEQQ